MHRLVESGCYPSLRVHLARRTGAHSALIFLPTESAARPDHPDRRNPMRDFIPSAQSWRSARMAMDRPNERGCKGSKEDYDHQRMGSALRAHRLRARHGRIAARLAVDGAISPPHMADRKGRVAVTDF